MGPCRVSGLFQETAPSIEPDDKSSEPLDLPLIFFLFLPIWKPVRKTSTGRNQANKAE